MLLLLLFIAVKYPLFSSFFKITGGLADTRTHGPRAARGQLRACPVFIGCALWARLCCRCRRSPASAGSPSAARRSWPAPSRPGAGTGPRRSALHSVHGLPRRPWVPWGSLDAAGAWGAERLIACLGSSGDKGPAGRGGVGLRPPGFWHSVGGRRGQTWSQMDGMAYDRLSRSSDRL